MTTTWKVKLLTWLEFRFSVGFSDDEGCNWWLWRRPILDGPHLETLDEIWERSTFLVITLVWARIWEYYKYLVQLWTKLVYHTTSTEMFDLNSCSDNTSQRKTTGRSTTSSVSGTLPVGGYWYYTSRFYYTQSWERVSRVYHTFDSKTILRNRVLVVTVTKCHAPACALSGDKTLAQEKMISALWR